MKRSLMVRCLVLIFLFIGMQVGCGTIHNLGDPGSPPSHGDQHLDDDNMVFHLNIYPHSDRDKVIFGGVMNDVALFTEPVFFITWIPAIIDLPLSLSADVLTLPVTVYWTVSTQSD